ncbi:MAG: HAMP domain-containing histidine kinase [Lachnospiraceae bacterium]|jgi:signal transduction histidine kinase|nr:HAMP domain-containing histidine kinase [Lachnospiraceae bacterium]MCI8986212.1 HAMP domain-containing histidine kinase [Lachnospiraceae bacterium]MCI9014089.1 HAMP domain-containing histidine kinase [Lachnospiraceae bacterium]MCI9253283.1 HAMP domain-containing histidine kinase [Lachnospiraceae bacterium]
MFRKAHFLFTLLCAGTTTAIMIFMSLLYLQVSENSLYKNHFASFRNDISTIASSLEQSTYISMQWLAGLEARNAYLIFVTDNDKPFLYNTLKTGASGTKGSNDTGSSNDLSGQYLLSESLQAYDMMFESETVISYSSNYFGIHHDEYEFTSPSTGEHYYSSLIDIERGQTHSRILILNPLAGLQAQITHQRLLFLLLDLLAALAFSVFSWFFTGRLLKPLQQNHENQMQFIASASHELRTPLSAILATNECCITATPQEQAGFFQTIRKEGRRMNTLIDDLLTLAHSDSGRFLIEKKEVELDTLCTNAYEAFEPLCRQKKLTLSLTLPDVPLPRLSCDPDRIAQVLSILLHNAVSYTPENGFVSLSLTCRQDRKNLFEITVSDTGVGIPDSDKKRIFSRFYRAEKSRSTKGHFGLGLSIAYEIISAHHGRISVQDNLPCGSVFVVRLPG